MPSQVGFSPSVQVCVSYSAEEHSCKPSPHRVWYRPWRSIVTPCVQAPRGLTRHKARATRSRLPTNASVSSCARRYDCSSIGGSNELSDVSIFGTNW